MSGPLDTARKAAANSFVLIGFAEALSAPEVAWSLVDAGYKVVAFGRRGRPAPLRYSRYVDVLDVTSPETDFPQTLRDLKALLQSDVFRQSAEKVFFPLDDASLWLSTQLELDSTWRRAAPPANIAELALDKAKQIRLARDSGFNVPLSHLATQGDDFSIARKSLPVIIRPAAAILPIGGKFRKGQNWICNSETELDRALENWRRNPYPVLIQPFVTGIGEGIFGLARNGEILACSAHRRLRMMNPHGSGSSACISQEVDSTMKQAAAKMIQTSDWDGLFMIELLRGENGTTWFVEFNGRPWGSMALARRAGFDYPAWAVDQTHGSTSPLPCNGPSNSRPIVCRNVGREFMHFLFVVRGPKSKAIKNWPSIFRTAIDLIPFGRGNSFYNLRANDLKVFAADCWITVQSNLRKARN